MGNDGFYPLYHVDPYEYYVVGFLDKTSKYMEIPKCFDEFYT